METIQLVFICPLMWYGGAHYLLCRGKEKATAELGLSFLAYNLRRAIKMLGSGSGS